MKKLFGRNTSPLLSAVALNMHPTMFIKAREGGLLPINDSRERL
jgi:hypothetical protein